LSWRWGADDRPQEKGRNEHRGYLQLHTEACWVRFEGCLWSCGDTSPENTRTQPQTSLCFDILGLALEYFTTFFVHMKSTFSSLSLELHRSGKVTPRGGAPRGPDNHLFVSSCFPSGPLMPPAQRFHIVDFCENRPYVIVTHMYWHLRETLTSSQIFSTLGD